MDAGTMKDWLRWRRLAEQLPGAAERGRLVAAHQIASDPEARKRVEEQFGVDLCRVRYPEAYRTTFSARVFDGIRKALKF